MSRMKEAKAALMPMILEVVRELVPGGKLQSGVYTARNPVRMDRKAGSFVVWVAGRAPGAWKDYASDDKGDLIGLIQYCLGLSAAEALAWAEERTGINHLDASKRAELLRSARQKQAMAEKTAQADDQRNANRARALWNAASPSLAGTVAERYLAARGIALANLKNLEASFRFMPQAEWWMGASEDPATGRRIAGPSYPALVSAMSNNLGQVCARHLTFLSPDGASKAPVEKPKLMFPRTEGLVIRATLGADGLTPEQAVKARVASPVLISEGVEDALTLALAAPNLRIWAAGSLAGLLSVPNHGCASAWIVAQDNDWNKPEAQKLFARALSRLKETGKPVTTIRARVGKDFNDELNGKA